MSLQGILLGRAAEAAEHAGGRRVIGLADGGLQDLFLQVVGTFLGDPGGSSGAVGAAAHGGKVFPVVEVHRDILILHTQLLGSHHDVALHGVDAHVGTLGGEVDDAVAQLQLALVAHAGVAGALLIAEGSPVEPPVGQALRSIGVPLPVHEFPAFLDAGVEGGHGIRVVFLRRAVEIRAGHVDRVQPQLLRDQVFRDADDVPVEGAVLAGDVHHAPVGIHDVHALLHVGALDGAVGPVGQVPGGAEAAAAPDAPVRQGVVDDGGDEAGMVKAHLDMAVALVHEEVEGLLPGVHAADGPPGALT